MSTNDESFFREVDEDYRREQTIQFFKNYGAYIVAGAFVILAIVGGYTIEQQRRRDQAAVGGDALSNAISLSEAGKDNSAELATLAENGPGAYRFIARLQAASESVAKNQRDPALGAYRSVADDASAPAALRDFARLQIAALSVDTATYETLAKDLDALRSGTSEWRFAAKEILGLSAFKNGKKEEAERLFGEIVSDGGAPQGMRQRAEVFLTLLLQKPKAVQPDATGKKDGADEAKTQ